MPTLKLASGYEHLREIGRQAEEMQGFLDKYVEARSEAYWVNMMEGGEAYAIGDKVAFSFQTEDVFECDLYETLIFGIDDVRDPDMAAEVRATADVLRKALAAIEDALAKFSST